MEKYIELEEKINDVNVLLEVIQGYCDSKLEQSNELFNIKYVIEMILSKQKEIKNYLDLVFLQSADTTK